MTAVKKVRRGKYRPKFVEYVPPVTWQSMNRAERVPSLSDSPALPEEAPQAA